MRVLHVAPSGFGAEGLFGGGERYPLELARALARAGEVDAELVTFGPHPRVARDPSGLVIRVLRPLAHLHHHPVHPVAPGLARALRKADIVHTHHMRSAPSRFAVAVGRAQGQPVAVTDHGLGGGGWCGLLPRLFDRFLTVSRYSAETLGAAPTKVRVIYGGADPERFAPDPREQRAGVLFVGRLTPHKGLDRLLEAMPRDIALTVVGTGGHDRRPPESDYPAYLRAQASDLRVSFRTAVSDDELAALYRRAAVLVLPSVALTCYGRRVPISELLGLAAIEAMASGTPVVASRIGGIPEVVRDGETGYLVEPGDVAGIRDRVATVLADRRLAGALGDNGREEVLTRFTWDACARRCLEAYRQLIR
jgi:glycosyltransferase involved in cell wall biosynthesis